LALFLVLMLIIFNQRPLLLMLTCPTTLGPKKQYADSSYFFWLMARQI